MNYLYIAAFSLLTIGAYKLSRWLFFRYGSPLFNMVFFGSVLVILTLIIFKIPYSMYEPSKDVMTFLLGPATVALAIPLYQNRMVLRKKGVRIIGCVVMGSLASVFSVILIGIGSGMEKFVVISAIPKSVTAPIAIEIAQISGGDPALAVAFVVATGTFGGAMGPTLLKWLGIVEKDARGLALGTVAHAQGVGMALIEGDSPGAMASSAMALAAVFTSIIAPLLVMILL
ncbi:MAG: LrgB family protein [Pelosinus sp.]|nr:LrgB family protein [Pelosinus sp.]